jgi:DNA-binding XRE family transcriptional regulator
LSETAGRRRPCIVACAGVALFFPAMGRAVPGSPVRSLAVLAFHRDLSASDLDDSAWINAPVASEVFQQETNEVRPATFDTECRVSPGAAGIGRVAPRGMAALPFCHLQLRTPKPDGRYPIQLQRLGDHIRKRRLDLGLLQKEVAARLGADPTTVNNWETGKSEPRLWFVPRILAFRASPLPLGTSAGGAIPECASDESSVPVRVWPCQSAGGEVGQRRDRAGQSRELEVVDRRRSAGRRSTVGIDAGRV